MDATQANPRPGKTSSSREAADLSPHELRKQLVQAGYVRALFDLMMQTPVTELDVQASFEELLRAADVASRRDPVGFSDSVFQAMLSFSSWVLFRVQFACARCLEKDDRLGRGREPRLGQEFTQVLWPQLQEVQGQVTEIAQAWVSTARLWQLAHRTKRDDAPAKAANRVHTGSGCRKATSKKGRKTPSPPNGFLPKNRLDDFLDNLPN